MISLNRKSAAIGWALWLPEAEKQDYIAPLKSDAKDRGVDWQAVSP